MPVGGAAEDGITVGEDDQFADAVGGELVGGGRLLAAEHLFDAGHGAEDCGGSCGVRVVEIDGGVGAQRAVVDDIGVGDGQNDPRFGDTGGDELGLDKLHLGGTVGVGFGVHAVIGGNAQDNVLGVECADKAVEAGVEGVGLWLAGCPLVLDEIGGRKVE